ncbi:hypothetical protein CC80DRAFT_225770 [Byssothecium circinans]|uniref:F-box domain-containing protein n=1 Tax=Byssothecium circinans TaxID=147558 RepID=A0A6A5TGG3_9PLEO|nr:hypothetical protein CC80DRAFT_225770 [Byssothecium circinans]
MYSLVHTCILFSSLVCISCLFWSTGGCFLFTTRYTLCRIWSCFIVPRLLTPRPSSRPARSNPTPLVLRQLFRLLDNPSPHCFYCLHSGFCGVAAVIASPTGGAFTTSSQIYLSRGVAGAQSAPSLPILARLHSRDDDQRPSYYIDQSMPYSSGPPNHPVPAPEELGHAPIHATNPSSDLRVASNLEARPALPKRSDVLRHVLPRPRSTSSVHKLSTHHTSERRKNPPSSSKISRRRVSFHKAITSFFHNHPASDGVSRPMNPPTGSSASIGSTRSGAGTGSQHGSMPSIDLVSPGAFLFSGPSLQSRTSSFKSNSTSRLPSFTENSSDRGSPRRLYSDDDFSLLEDGVMEPYVDRGLARSMSDVLLGTSTPIEELESPGLEDVEEDVQSIPEDTSTTLHIPIELVQHVYRHLSPKDFNSARHACRHWFRASLDRKILVSMLRRGGWWNDQGTDVSTVQSSSAAPSEEWALSRRLSRECALSSNWTGNGLDSVSGRGTNVIAEMSHIDLNDFANGSSSQSRKSGGLVFTTSVCGEYMLVARDALIYIYQLRGTNLIPWTSVVCPRRVLSVSMDVSSGRNAVAALLEGRMGMVSDVLSGCTPESSRGLVEIHVESQKSSFQTDAQASAAASTDSYFEAGVGSSSRDQSEFSNAENDRVPFESVDIQSNYQAVSLQAVNDHRSYPQNHINQTWNLHLRGPRQVPSQEIEMETFSAHTCSRTIPVENGPSTFYRHLCSEDDPPRSVSICPQRRCVAFGCSAGIELHWIDALTKQSLSR